MQHFRCCNAEISCASLRNRPTLIDRRRSIDRRTDLESPMTKSTAVRLSQSPFARTRQALANAATRLNARRRVEQELGSLSDRALADIGLYRSDISEFAYAASI